MEAIKTHVVRVPGGTRTVTLLGPNAVGTNALAFRVTAMIQFDSGNYYKDADYSGLGECPAYSIYEREVAANKAMGFEKTV